jgi:hypothetical protein
VNACENVEAVFYAATMTTFLQAILKLFVIAASAVANRVSISFLNQLVDGRHYAINIA